MVVFSVTLCDPNYLKTPNRCISP